MRAPATPANETERLAALRELGVLDTPPEERFDRITRLAMRLFNVPIALLSLVDVNRQWFKSCYGLKVSETGREVSFCGHTILEDAMLIIPDATKDARFADNPLVTGPPNIRFYGGHVLRGPRAHKLGTLCLIDDKPREFTDADRKTLTDLAAMTERELNLAEVSELQGQLLKARDAEQTLLLNILPTSIAERLQRREEVIADCLLEVTILFADLHDFGRLTEGMDASAMVQQLNEIVSRFDALTGEHGLEKIKTNANAYMVAGGVPTARKDHAEAVADLALEMQQEIVRFIAPGGESFQLRIGINTGPVVAGVIGKTKFSYDLWGETVATAWDLAALGAPGNIQVNETTEAILRDKYIFEDRGEYYIKDKGTVRISFLKGKKRATR